MTIPKIPSMSLWGQQQTQLTDVVKAEEELLKDVSENTLTREGVQALEESIEVGAKYEKIGASTATSLGDTLTREGVQALEEGIKIGEKYEKMGASLSSNVTSIPGDTLYKQSRKVTALVPVGPVLTPKSLSSRIEAPNAQLRYLNYPGASVLSTIPRIGFYQQAKMVVPSKLFSGLVLFGTQELAQKKLGDGLLPVLASWTFAVGVENGINIPINAVRHQIQHKLAKTPFDALLMIKKQKGLVGLYKAYPVNTLSGTVVNISLNVISPGLQSIVDGVIPDSSKTTKLLSNFLTGAVSNILAIPATQFVHNINEHQLDLHNKKGTCAIIAELYKGGPKVMLKGWQYGVKRAAVIGAVYQGTIGLVQSGQKKVKKKHVQAVIKHIETAKTVTKDTLKKHAEIAKVVTKDTLKKAQSHGEKAFAVLAPVMLRPEVIASTAVVAPTFKAFAPTRSLGKVLGQSLQPKLIRPTSQWQERSSTFSNQNGRVVENANLTGRMREVPDSQPVAHLQASTADNSDYGVVSVG